MIDDEDNDFGVNYSRSTWLSFDPTDDPQKWALQQARDGFGRTTYSPTEAEVDDVANGLKVLCELIAEMDGVVLGFWTSMDGLPDPIAIFEVVEPTNGTPAALAALAGADQPENFEPPTVTPIDTPMGEAIRVARSVPADLDADATASTPLTLMRLVTYAWAPPDYDANVTLTCGSPDLARMVEVEKHLDELARGMSARTRH